MDEKTAPRLARDYYLKNFQFLLKFCAKQYDDLLSQRQKKFIEVFKTLNRNQRLLYVRLASRSSEFFLLSKLNYDEINIERGIKDNPLLETQLKKINKNLEDEELKRIVNIEHLKSFLVKSNIKVSQYKGKDQLWDKVSADVDSFKKHLNQNEGLIQVKYQEHFDTLLFLFFGNMRQTLSDFILEDVGSIKYPKYKIQKKTRIFKKKSDIGKGYKLSLLQEEQYFAREEKDVEAILENLSSLDKLGSMATRFSQKRKALYLRGARALESAKEYEKALHYYKKADILNGRERIVRILYAMEEYQKAWQKFKVIMKNPLNHGEEVFVKNFYNKFHSPLGVEKRKKIELIYDQQNLIVKNTSERVESLSLKELKRRGWSGFYCENNYWNLLFALSFWDVIFKSCEGAFAHPFQRSPLDLYEDDFFKRRKSVLKKALCLFDNPTCYKAEIKQRFDEYEGQVNPFVSWKAIDRKNFI
ncbi:hypothetical protein OAT67_09460, partial [Bacteriovoracaceae bacterium]|nr:hypothetical protein [Bacteriovoracaceae bacterium]